MNDHHHTVTDIKHLLDEAGVVYKFFVHEAVRTSEEAAATRPEYTLAQGAKALIVRMKKKSPSGMVRQFAQLVVPGDQKFDPKKARMALAATDIRFATPAEVADITDGIEPGGVPPFGNLFGLPVVVDRLVLENDTIIFNAGDRRCSIALQTDDYVRLVQPMVAPIV